MCTPRACVRAHPPSPFSPFGTNNGFAQQPSYTWRRTWGVSPQAAARCITRGIMTNKKKPDNNASKQREEEEEEEPRFDENTPLRELKEFAKLNKIT